MRESLDLPGRLRAWSYRRQQLGRTAADPTEALRSVVAAYSSHPTAPLALLSRTRALDAAGFGALEERRETLRLPAMRQSIFFMPAETAPRIFAATRLPLEQHARRVAYAGLEWDEYARLKERVLAHTQAPIAASDLQRALASEERATSEVRIMVGVRIMTSEGLVLRLGSSLRTDSLRYVATEAWLGRPLAEADPLESLAWLAEAYLREYGPARVADFAWWCGVPRRRAAAALSAADVADVGAGLLLPADQQTDFASLAPLDPEVIDVLPKWDAYTMGYAPDGRERLVADEHLGRAYSSARVGGAGATSGDGLPLVLRGGRAVASWSHRFAGSRMLVTVTPFEPDALPSQRYEHAFDAVGQLLGATAVAVVAAPASS